MSFEVGDKVIDLSYGVGTVSEIIQNSIYPIVVLFEQNQEQYTTDGHSHVDVPFRSLYHSEGFVYPRDKEPERKPKCQFKPFDKVLVRNENYNSWFPCLFACYVADTKFPYQMTNTLRFRHCIPYEGNEDKCGKVTE